MIWLAVVRKAVWAFWSLAGCLAFLQAAGFASDTFLGNRDLLANTISSVLLLSGIALSASLFFMIASRPKKAMQRTAGRSAFPLPMTSTFNQQPRSPSPAVP